MGRLTLTPKAQADIEEIWDYSAAHWGIEQAEDYVRLIRAAIETITLRPRKGRSCEAIRAGYWKYPAASHVIFYKSAEDGVEVVRILHKRMDFTRHL